jgi:membrane-bound lytic murein transglycosylase D
MPQLIIRLGLLVISIFFAALLWGNDASDRSIPPYDEKEVKERLQELHAPLFKPKYNRIVRAYIKGYVLRNRTHTEVLLGRTAKYFPIFERLLKAHNMPEALKYLPIVESALRPKAISHVGAGGLWQFMPETAKEYGLVINETVDERFDPHKSTEAAIAYLAKHYEKYESWPLALAAYNGGSGRVSRAIKRGRSRNFWRIKRYLPRETRNYVSAYLAAVYLMEYYEAHNLSPQYPNLDQQITATIKLHTQLSFYKIAQLTDLPLSLIQTLNPSYEQGFIPASKNGNYLILPERVADAVNDYLKAQATTDLKDHPIHQKPIVVVDPYASPEDAYRQQLIFVEGRQTLDSIAQQLDIAAYHLRVWNAIPIDSAAIADTILTLFEPTQVRGFNPALPISISPLFTPKPTPIQQAFQPMPIHNFQGQVIVYAPTQKIRLRDFAAGVHDITLDSLLQLNALKPKSWIRAGEPVVIYQF